MITLGIQGGLSHPAPAPQPGVAAPDHPLTPAAAGPEVLRPRLQAAVGERFEVQEAVAIGGMATLYRLRHTEHGGMFAAKVLHEELAGRPEVLASFRREAAHAARLGDHPNAIPVLDAGEHDGLHYLLMPFVEGEDLDQLLREHGPLRREEALHFVAQISSLLCHAESHGITHGDLAPGNIRLDMFGRYRLMDFGISQAADDPDAKPLGGTPLYTSPEQLRGERIDSRADLYALGLLLAEVLLGRPLLEAGSLAELRELHLRGDHALPDVLRDDLPVARLLGRLLARERENRFRSAFELSGALAALGYERPEFRPRPAGARPGAPATRRNRLS